MNTIIENGTIVNEGKVCRGSVVIQDDRISEIIFSTEPPRGNYDKRVDATGCFVLPGVIDEHVHFRQPGMTDKGDIESESRAAAMGGVTSFFDMPNTNPMTTTLETLDEKIQMAVRDSHINYSFFFGATNQNSSLFKHLDPHIIPGIKVFMGASTGNMLVDNSRALEKIFQTAAFLNLPVMTHCEDSAMITANMKIAKEKYGDDPDVIHHYEIRNADACHHSSKLAIELAKRFGTQLHIAHLSTAKELSLIDDVEVRKLVTLEAVIAHLVLSCAVTYTAAYLYGNNNMVYITLIVSFYNVFFLASLLAATNLNKRECLPDIIVPLSFVLFFFIPAYTSLIQYLQIAYLAVRVGIKFGAFVRINRQYWYWINPSPPAEDLSATR